MMNSLPLPVLYSFRRCPYAMRARLALLVSGQRCELREVVLRAKPAALLAVSPKGTVPVLVQTDGRVIEQSLDIMRWALSLNDPGQWLQPEQDGQAAMMRLVAECDGAFKTQLDRYKYPSRYATEVAAFADSGRAFAEFPNIADSALAFSLWHRRQATLFLDGLEQRLQRAPWLFGQRASLADMAIAPFVRQFAQHDEAWFQSQPWPGLQAWLEAIVAGEAFAAIMLKVPAWQPDMPVVVFPGQ